jgi:hypothetical protein
VVVVVFIITILDVTVSPEEAHITLLFSTTTLHSHKMARVA